MRPGGKKRAGPLRCRCQIAIAPSRLTAVQAAPCSGATCAVIVPCVLSEVAHSACCGGGEWRVEIDWTALRALAAATAGRAHAPYSRLRVGAAGQAATAGHRRLQRGERVLRAHAVRRMRPGVRAARLRGRHDRGGQRPHPDGAQPAAVRPVPSGAARGGRPGLLLVDTGSRPGRSWNACCRPRSPARSCRAPAMTEAAGGDLPAPAAVDLIRAKRDGRDADRRRDPLADRGLRPRRGRRRADVRAADGHLLPRPAARRAAGLDRRDDRVGGAARPVRRAAAHRGQALDRRRRRQGVADPGPAGRGVRGRGAAAVRPRPRPHRRDARQAGGDPRLAGHPVPGRDDRRRCARWAASSARPVPGSPRPTASSTRCATSPGRSSRSR